MASHEYLDFEIEIGLGLGGREYPLTVIRSPGGEARERLIFPFDELALGSRLKDLQIALLRSGGKRRQALTREEQTVRDFGERLFAAIITDEVRSRYDVSQQMAARQGKGLRVKLRIQPPELASLPWEFLYDPRASEYICLSTKTPLVRYIALPHVIQPLAIVPPLRILGVTASPRGLATLDMENEKLRIDTALASLIERKQVDITWQDHATWQDLLRLMRSSRGPWHILHFIGHGGFNRESDEGFIALESEAGEMRRMPATQLGRLIADNTTMRLAVMNSCEGAQGSAKDVFSSTASLLVRRGLPAVLAMQYEITDRAAIEFARGFYEAITDGLPVDAATAEARKSVSLAVDNTIEWGTPVLFMRAPDGVLFNQVTPEEARRLADEQRARGKSEDETVEIARSGAAEQGAHEETEREIKKASEGQLTEKKKITKIKIVSLISWIKQQLRSRRRYFFIGIAGLLVVFFGIWALNSQPRQDEPDFSYLYTAGAETVIANATLAPKTQIITSTPMNLPVLVGTAVPLSSQKITTENANQVVQLARWGKGTVQQVSYSPAGRILAVASSLGIYFYDATSLDQIRFIDTNSWIHSIAFSSNGNTLVSGSQDGTVHLWQVNDGSLLQTFEGHTAEVLSVAFSPDGRTLASSSTDKSIRLWRISDGSLLQKIDEINYTFSSLAFSPLGDILALGSPDGVIRLLQASDGSFLRTIEEGFFGINEIAFSPDGIFLATSSNESIVFLWQVSDGELVQEFVADIPEVLSLAYSPDGNILASGCADGTVYLWQTQEGELLQVLEGPKDRVRSLSFSPDGSTLVSGSDDGNIFLWENFDISAPKALHGYKASVASIAFSPDGETEAFGSLDGTIYLWRSSDDVLLQTLEGHTSKIVSLTFSPDGNTLASGSKDGTIRLWQVSDGTLLALLGVSVDSFFGIAFSPDGEILASGSPDGLVRLWRVNDGVLFQGLEDNSDAVTSVAFSPDGEALASGLSNGSVHLWRISDGFLLQAFEGPPEDILSLAFSPNGEILASRSPDNTILLWRVSDGNLLQTLEVGSSNAMSFTFSPSGDILASGSKEGILSLWKVSDGSLLQKLDGHISDIVAVAFSSDGNALTSGSYDGTVRLWGIVP